MYLFDSRCNISLAGRYLFATTQLAQVLPAGQTSKEPRFKEPWIVSFHFYITDGTEFKIWINTIFI